MHSGATVKAIRVDLSKPITAMISPTKYPSPGPESTPARPLLSGIEHTGMLDRLSLQVFLIELPRCSLVVHFAPATNTRWQLAQVMTGTVGP